MIFTESTIKISNNVSKMDSTIVLYRGDKNVEIRFTILQSPFKYSNTVATNVIESTNASYGQLVIKTPNSKPPIFSEVSATKEGTVLFTITKEMIDEIEEVGVYTFQIRLMDENKQSRVTIPPVENGIEIKEPIAIEDDNTTNVVGLAKANYAVATLSDVDTPAFDDNGKYIKTNWNDGDVITNASLNKIEDGIYTTNENVTATKKYVDDGINYNNKQFNNKISAINMSRHPVSCSTEIYKKPLCDIFPELLNITYNTVFKESNSFKVNMDNFVKEYPTVKSAYNKLNINLYDENDNSIGNSYGNSINGEGLNIIFINITESLRFYAYFDKALVDGSGTTMETKNGYMTIQLLIPKSNNKQEFIDKIKNLKLTLSVFRADFLNLNNETIYTPTTDYNPATKKYVDDNRIGYIKSETVGETIDTSTMINSFNNNSYIYESNNVTYLEMGKEYHVIVNGVRYRVLCINNMPGNDQIYESIIVTGDGFSISIMNKMGYNTKYYTDNTKCAYEIKLSDELLAAPPTIQILKMDIEYIPTYLMPKDLEILNSISVNRIGDIGTGSAAIGYKNTASNDFTFAMGIQATASAPGAHAEGGLTVANASYSHAEGFKSASTGEYSHVEGIVCESSGQGSHAEGYYTVSSGQRSHSEGCFTEAASQYQHVQGKYNVVDSNGVYAHIVGNGTGKNNRHNAHTLDWQGNAWFAGEVQGTNLPYTISSKVLATVPASDIKIDGEIAVNNISINKDRRYYIEFLGSKKLCSLLINGENGDFIICSIGNYSIGIYNNTFNISIYIDKINTSDTTDTFTDLIIYEEEVKYLDNKYLETDLVLQNSISLGRIGDIGTGSSAIGYDVEASGDFSHAEGNGAKASGMDSHAEGFFTIASGDTSHAEGESTTASGMSSHTEGNSTTASGKYAHAEGATTTASGDYGSHAEGSNTIARGVGSHAEGNCTTASAYYSHAEGDSTTASGENSHAEGKYTTASGTSSHAEGDSTTASEYCSHAEGNCTTASGENSHAEGASTIASSQNQHVQGRYNIEDKANKYAHIVGNGEDGKNSNAHTLDWEGNAWYAGKLSQEGTPTEDKDLTTKKYVDDKVSNLPQFSFNDAGELVVTINGVSKTFVPKNV